MALVVSDKALRPDDKSWHALVPSLVEKPKSQSYTFLSKQDYDILLEGNDASIERTNRDLGIGVTATALTALIGVLGTGQFTDQNKNPLMFPIIFAILLGVLTVVAGLLSIYFNKRINKILSRGTYLDVKNRIDKFFNHS